MSHVFRPPWFYQHPRLRWVPSKTAGQVVAVGQVTETDLAQAISWAPKNRLVGQATETDLAQAITSSKIKAIGQVTETDLAQAISSRKLKALSQVSETDLAQAISSRKTKTLGQVSETDLAQTITPSGTKIIAVDQATETDLAQAIASSKVKALGQPAETDLAQAITRVKSRALGQATETDAAQAIAWAPKIRLVGQATETDAAQAITVVSAAAPARDLGAGGGVRRPARDDLHLRFKRYTEEQERVAEEQAVAAIRIERKAKASVVRPIDQPSIAGAIKASSEAILAKRARKLRSLAKALPALTPQDIPAVRPILRDMTKEALVAMRNDRALQEQLRVIASIELQRRNDDVILAVYAAVA